MEELASWELFFFESQVAGMFRANIYVGASSNGWDLGRNFPPIKRSNKEAQLRKWKALSPFRNAQERRQVVPAGLFFGHPSGRMGGGGHCSPFTTAPPSPIMLLLSSAAEQQLYGPSPYDPPFSSGSLILVLCAL